MIKSYLATDIGHVRKDNEDASAILPRHAFVVADGMGGHAGGGTASQILVHSVRQYIDDFGDRALQEDDLAQAILAANRDILATAFEKPALRGMGTTAVLLALDKEKARWAHVGDSRLYLLRAGKLRQVTRDHSLVEELVCNGTITEEEARVHPRKNILTRAVGVEVAPKVDSGSFALADGDRFLLCTDGLTNMVEDVEIQNLMQNTGDVAHALVQKALAAGGHDNVTALVVAIDGA